MLTKTALRNRILLIIGVLIVANWLFSRLYFRLDFTADKRYTLSNATRNILSGLEEPITVTGYFSDNLPPAVNKARTDFEEMLVEYANASGGNLVFDFVNPSETPEKEKEVQQAGIQPVR
nr:GldG family protein [Chitinophagales bacterium]